MIEVDAPSCDACGALGAAVAKEIAFCRRCAAVAGKRLAGTAAAVDAEAETHADLARAYAELGLSQEAIHEATIALTSDDTRAMSLALEVVVGVLGRDELLAVFRVS